MKYIKKKLKNGMTVIMVPTKNIQIITMGFFVKAGSRNETEENSGIAHFLEHMMFKGTKDRNIDKLFKELDTLGSYYNAVTTVQSTHYYVYGNSDDTKKILDIVLDLYLNPTFDANEIQSEKKVIIEEMRMRSDRPLMKLYSVLHRKIFRNTSLARDIIGTPETVLKLRRKDFVEFRNTFYTPENTVFVITGNFNPVPIYKMISQVLQPLENPKNVNPKYDHEKSIILKTMYDQDEPYVYIKKNVLYQQAYILLAFPLYDLYSTQYNETNLLSHLLSSGFSSRLNKSLREDHGITYSLATYPIVYADVSLFLIQMILNPIELVAGLKILMREIKRTKEEKMTKEEMTKIINVSKNENIYSLIKPLEIFTYFGLNVLENRNFEPNIKKELQELEKITRSDVQKTAQKIFIRDKINLFIYGNVQETDFNFLDL